MFVEIYTRDLAHREPVQFENGNSARQRFAYRLHQLQFLRSREIKQRFFIGIIEEHLNARKEGGASLHFVYHQRARIVQQEKPDVLRRLRK